MHPDHTHARTYTSNYKSADDSDVFVNTMQCDWVNESKLQQQRDTCTCAHTTDFGCNYDIGLNIQIRHNVVFLMQASGVRVWEHAENADFISSYRTLSFAVSFYWAASECD